MFSLINFVSIPDITILLENGTRPRKRKVPRKPLCLTPQQLEAVLKTRSYPLELMSTLVGSMKIVLHNHHYRKIHSHNGYHYCRCISYATTDCGAVVLRHDSQIYVIDGDHNHPEPQVPASDLTQHIDVVVACGNSITKPPSSNGSLKIDLKTQIARRLKQLQGFVDM